MKYGVIGSRRRTDKQSVVDFVRSLHDGDSVVSGGCKGVDTWAVEAAAERGLHSIVHHPTPKGAMNKFSSMNAYKARNHLIAEDCDILVAFVAADRKGGAEMTIKFAEKLGKKVIIKTEKSALVCDASVMDLRASAERLNGKEATQSKTAGEEQKPHPPYSGVPHGAIRPHLFGSILYNYFNGDKTPFAIRRDDGWYDGLEDPGMYFEPQVFDIERKGMKLAKGTVLDIGLGAGRHALAFQKHGLKVIGVDSDAFCVKTAKARGVKLAFTENIFQPKRIKKYRFDTVWLGGNNLGVAGTVRKLPVLLGILEKLTADDAVILATGMEVDAPRGTAGALRGKTKNPDHLAYQKRQRAKGINPGQMKLRIEYKDKVGEWFPWLHVSSALLKEALKGSAWTLRKIIRGKDGHYLAVMKKRKGGVA